MIVFILEVKIRSLRERWYHDAWHEWLRNVLTFSRGSGLGLGEVDPFVSPAYHGVVRP